MQGLTNTTDKHVLADGNTELDWEITGDLTVLLRAESSGLGNGRVYTIHIECTDNSQNVATGW